MSMNEAYQHIKCRFCGTINNAGVVRCEKCGSDLDLYGEPIINDTDREEWAKYRKTESEKAAAEHEERQREQEQRERERAAAEQKERERLDAEQREKERVAEEQQKNKDEASDMARVRAEQERIRRLNEQKQREDEKLKAALQEKDRRKKSAKKTVLITIGVILGIAVLAAAIFLPIHKSITTKLTAEPTAVPIEESDTEYTQIERNYRLEDDLYDLLNQARTELELDEFDLDMHIDNIAYDYNNDMLTRGAEAPYDLPYNLYNAIKSDAGNEYNEVDMTILQGSGSAADAIEEMLDDDSLYDEEYNSIGICVLNDEGNNTMQWFVIYAKKIDMFAGIQ